MDINTRIVIAVCLTVLLAMPVAHLVLADSVVPAAPRTGKTRVVPALPKQAAFAHSIRLRVLKVTPVDRIGKTQLLKLAVERHYGKMETRSLERAKKHETQQLTILFPATHDADIQSGDLIDYWLVGCTAIGRE